jgi:hypothetical protein
VAGDGNGGIGVYSTTTGNLVRTISTQGSGGPDQQAVLTGTGIVYFTQPEGACGGTIQAVPMSGISRSVQVVSVPGTLALEPEPNPTSTVLAWVGVTCGPNGTRSSLMLTNIATGSSANLGPYFGRDSDNGLSWSRDGGLLAVEAAPTVKVLRVGDSALVSRSLVVARSCFLTDPAFLPSPRQIAVVRTCYTATGSEKSSNLLVYDAATGVPTALIAAAPNGETIQSVSVDADGHILVGVSNSSAGAETSEVRHGRFVTVSRWSTTGAEW